MVPCLKVIPKSRQQSSTHQRILNLLSKNLMENFLMTFPQNKVHWTSLSNRKQTNKKTGNVWFMMKTVNLWNVLTFKEKKSESKSTQACGSTYHFTWNAKDKGVAPLERSGSPNCCTETLWSVSLAECRNETVCIVLNLEVTPDLVAFFSLIVWKTNERILLQLPQSTSTLIIQSTIYRS